MVGGNTLVLVLTASLIFIRVIVAIRHSDYNEQGRRKLAADTSGFISIDCGAPQDRHDDDTGLIYQSDNGFIDTGVNMPVSPQYNSVNPQVLRDLRSFPQGTKNCYTLKPEAGGNNKYLIRALFYYGNYDGKRQPPMFDLYLGVNKWDTFDSSLSGFYREIIHFSLTDNIYVCLVNTGYGTPFISALELRLLNSSIYKTDSGALETVVRYNVGGSKDLRYPDDVYDRIWSAHIYSAWYQLSTQSTIDTQSSNDPYDTPSAVLQTAAETLNYSTSLTYTWIPTDITTKFYVYFHFAEIQSLSSQVRELNIYFNGVNALAQPIQLDQYLKPVTVGPPTLTSTTGEFTFAIFGTIQANLPPILNAFEIFELKVLPDSPTNQDDVDAIMYIKQVYTVTRNWQGDPCIPIAYSWDGLNCSSDNPPRIISLNLASSKLTGNIASSLSNLTSIQTLDLSNNDLTGPVPEFLAQLPSLKTLNLAGNKLSGSIPQALLDKASNGSLLLSVDKNPDLCATNPCENTKNEVVLVVIIGAVVVLFILIGLGTFFWYHSKKQQEELNNQGSLKRKSMKFTYSDIVKMTDNFKKERVIGGGGFGMVYEGILKKRYKVAVKVPSVDSQQGLNEFHAEAENLTRVHHRNLVSLYGYCNENKHMALVYEYMVHGNLKKQLSETDANVLDWKKRLEIAIGAAKGLDYLHNQCEPHIIHRDMKTSNILLTKNWEAKIADFGLSRVLKNEGQTREFAAPAGTPGYIDPEYEDNQRFSNKSDVYSFGIVLLELITGQSVQVRDRYKSVHLTEWVKLWPDIKNIVDQKFRGHYNPNSATKAFELAMSCVKFHGSERPDMSSVVAELEQCLVIETKGAQDRVQQDKKQAAEIAMSRAKLPASQRPGTSDIVPEPEESLAIETKGKQAAKK